MRHFDHIVIGAGSAGCAVAARLSEDPDRQVLLVEAGGSPANLNVLAPLAFSKQFHGKGDWDYYTEPEPGLDDRRIFEPRGKVLGGCSAMNAMLWVRGHPLDYDGWGIDGWSWEECLPYFERIEHAHHLPDRAHGEAGPVHITNLDSPDPLVASFIDAAAAAGVPRNSDLSGPELEGTGHSPVTIWKGRRWHAARAYLREARKRPNLTIETKAQVHRVVVHGGQALGIEYERHGRRRAAGSRGDVVLSAGAFNTPHLLQLSGVGSADHLRELGIDTLVDSPAVGANLSEHPATLINWELAAGQPGLSDATHPKWLLRWLIGGKGKLASNIAEALAHVRTREELEAPDFQLLFGPAFFWEHGAVEHPKPAMVIAQSYWTPASRGTVRARSRDPRELPEVRLNMLSRARGPRGDDRRNPALPQDRGHGAARGVCGRGDPSGRSRAERRRARGVDPRHRRAHLPPGLHSADGRAGRRRRRRRAACAWRGGSAGGRHLGAAEDHPREHQRAGDDGGRALRGVHPSGRADERRHGCPSGRRLARRPRAGGRSADRRVAARHDCW